LRPATGKRGAIHRVTFVRLMKNDLISKTHRRTLHRERPKLQRTLCRLTSCRHTRLDSWRLKQKSPRGVRAPRRLIVNSLPYPIPRESSVGSSITAVVVSP
jgi:hypothetical protein